MKLYDKNGSELQIGDNVTLTGKIVDVFENNLANLSIENGSGVEIICACCTHFVKEGETDTAKAARAGFNSK